MQWLKYVLAILCVAIICLMLYYRAGIELYFAQLFHTKKNFSAEKYPIDFKNFQILFSYGYKWSFSIVFTAIYSLCSFGLVWLLFPFKNVARTMIILYGSIFLLMIFFSLISLLMHNYESGFGIVYYLKKLVQTPYLTIFLILYYWKINDPKM